MSLSVDERLQALADKYGSVFAELSYASGEEHPLITLAVQQYNTDSDGQEYRKGRAIDSDGRYSLDCFLTMLEKELEANGL